MPIAAPVLIAGIGAGASLLGQAGSALSQGSMNKQTRRWSNWMYDKQRADALTDWYMQNDYNTPINQMNRLRAAGLNPNLVYGHGADAQSSNSVRQSTAPQWSPRAPQFEGGFVRDSLQQYYDVQMREAQVDNLKAQNTVIKQDALLKAAQTLNQSVLADKGKVESEKIWTDTELKHWELEFRNEFRNMYAEAMRLGLEKKVADIQFTISENERRAIQNEISVRVAAERILSMRVERETNQARKDELRQRIKVLTQDERIKRLDAELKARGIQPHDKLWQRTLMELIQESIGIENN